MTFKRPPLNQIVDSLEHSLDRIPKQFYLSYGHFGSWGLHTDVPEYLWVHMIVGSRDRKFLRKLVKDKLDELEVKYNDRRRSAPSRESNTDTKVNRNDY